ncbi:MAG: GTP 3',8-cyclase MoaA [Bacillota bacterium]
MLDSKGRDIRYLRLSITERCTLKCAYCRAGNGDCPRKNELTAGEFERIVKAMAKLGIIKIRVTGGEPLLRRDVEDIIARISVIPGITEIAMTTNAQHLSGRTEALKCAGLTRLNISLDSLKRERYAELTGGGDFDAVMDGINEAVATGLHPVKLNMVVVRGSNDDEIDDFIALAKDRPVDVRFIELMPIGELGLDASKRVSTDEILAARPYLIPIPPRYPGQPSKDYTIEGFKGRVGFISPLSHKFCGACNRVRVMSDGVLKTCLGNNNEVSLLSALEKGDAALLETIHDAIYHKPLGHEFESGFSSVRDMSKIGG